MKAYIEKTQRIFDDFFKIEEAIISYEKFNGSMSEPVRRLNFERGETVAVLIYNIETDKVILVNQFRYPAFTRGNGWLTEVVAGMLNANENPEDCVMREVEEETGYLVTKLQHISTFFVSPGGSSEKMLLYYTEVRINDKISDGGGLIEESEDIKLVEFSPLEFKALLENGTLIDAKTIIAAQWFVYKYFNQ